MVHDGVVERWRGPVFVLNVGLSWSGRDSCIAPSVTVTDTVQAATTQTTQPSLVIIIVQPHQPTHALENPSLIFADLSPWKTYR